MKIAEFLHKNDQKIDKSKLIKALFRMALYILLVYMFGKTVYLVILGMRITSSILGF